MTAPSQKKRETNRLQDVMLDGMNARVILILCVCLGARVTSAQTPEQLDFFERRVRPVLVEHCFSCHAAKKQMSGLRLDSRKALLEGGDNGPALVPGHPEKSPLIAAIRYGEKR